MYLRPFSGHVLLEPLKASDVTKGGIFIPEISQGDLKSQFRVVSCGKGKVVKLANGTHLRLAPEIKTGDVVVANTFAGREIECDGKILRIMEQSSVAAIVQGGENDSLF